mgnify:CR=1 FL=1|jgi:hypothetical protein|tara:strand:+ start:237 stop:536 length:300 start_codon:yes stop_codon:yes gene_type:complete
MYSHSRREKEAEKIVDALRDAGNAARYRDINDVLEVSSRLHRTEKQSVGSLVFALLSEWSRDYVNKNYDARNEATCKRAHKMVEGLSENERVNFWMPHI